jgi:hypothetical protein
VCPAATEGGVRECLGHGCCDAAGAVGDDEDDPVGIEATPYERTQEHSPRPWLMSYARLLGAKSIGNVAAWRERSPHKA